MTAESGTAGAGAGATRTLGGATGAAARARAGRADDVDARRRVTDALTVRVTVTRS
jgi:hypothetical protein